MTTTSEPEEEQYYEELAKAMRLTKRELFGLLRSRFEHVRRQFINDYLDGKLSFGDLEVLEHNAALRRILFRNT